MDNKDNLINPVQFLKPCTYPTASPGKYLIGDKGDVYNNDTGKKLSTHMKPNQGYIFVHIRDENNIDRTTPIHRLVAYEFCDGIKKIQDNPYVDHIDCNKTNNFYKNLEWVTPMENSHRAIRNNCGGHFIAGQSLMSKTNEDEVKDICERLQEYNGDIWKCFESLGYNMVKDNKRVFNLIQSVKYKKAHTHISKDYNF